MNSAAPATCGVHTVAVSNPGGLARHYRVQYWESAESGWQKHGTFTQRRQAESDCEQLRQRGCLVRIVQYSICPAAV